MLKVLPFNRFGVLNTDHITYRSLFSNENRKGCNAIIPSTPDTDLVEIREVPDPTLARHISLD